MADGTEKSIDKIKIGDQVLGLEKGKAVKANVVDQTDYVSSEGIYKIKTDYQKTIKVTGNHPFLTETGYQEVSQLQSGEKIYIFEQGNLTQTIITSIEKKNKKVKVYNIEVDGPNNYIAEGVVVHNKNIPPEQIYFEPGKFLLPGNRWPL